MAHQFHCYTTPVAIFLKLGAADPGEAEEPYIILNSTSACSEAIRDD